MEKFGTFAKSQITNIPADLTTEKAMLLKKAIPLFADECMYIYSFKENRMIFANGWESVCGYKDEEVNLQLIVETTVPVFIPFSMELNDKALMFILHQRENPESYSFSIELKKIHKNGLELPIIAKVGVFESENGIMTSIIGRWQVNHSLKFGKVMKYAAYGPEKNEFEEELNKELFMHMAISHKEKEALALAAKGYSLKEISSLLMVSQSAVEKRIIPLYKRFDCRSLSHLVSFAYENNILP